MQKKLLDGAAAAGGSAPEESEELLQFINNAVEGFLTSQRPGKEKRPHKARRDESYSTSTALQASAVMMKVVECFRDLEGFGDSVEQSKHSIALRQLRDGESPAVVASSVVERLLGLIKLTGDALLRARFCTLLLMNTTRRILSIIREVAAQTKMTELELDEEAERFLRRMGDLSDSEEDEEEEEQSPRSPLSGTTNTSITTGGGVGGSSSPERRAGLRAVHFPDLSNTAGSPLMNRASSFLATELPGQQMLKRAPSKREQSYATNVRNAHYSVHLTRFFRLALENMDDFMAGLEAMTEQLCSGAHMQLHSSDTVITIGSSHTTRQFLLSALAHWSTRGPLKIILLEGAPTLAAPTHALEKELRHRGAAVQLLPDSSAFAVMSSCTKVLVGAESVLANGGMLAPIGTHMLCLAARTFSVPVIVATTTLKVSPFYPSDSLCSRLVRIGRNGAQEVPWSTYGNPEQVLPAEVFYAPCGGDGMGEEMEDSSRRRGMSDPSTPPSPPPGVAAALGSLGSMRRGVSLTVHTPTMEYVPPEAITLYSTDDTEMTPSQVHRFVREHYSNMD